LKGSTLLLNKQIGRLTAEVLPSSVLIWGVLIVIVSGFELLILLMLGIIQAKVKEVSMSLQSILGCFVSEFVSRLLQSIALLPSAA
jgi:hypothetical protein